MEHKINVISWLKSYYSLPFSTDAFEKANNSLDFLWIWSVFEAKYFDHNQGAKKYSDQIIDVAEKFANKYSDFDNTFEFFKERYYNSQKTTDKFNNLGLWSKRKKRVESILKNPSPTKKEKLEMIFTIIYKFRCNLFHGSKDPLLWRDFDSVFYQINIFLISFLDSLKKNT